MQVNVHLSSCLLANINVDQQYIDGGHSTYILVSSTLMRVHSTLVQINIDVGQRTLMQLFIDEIQQFGLSFNCSYILNIILNI